MVLADVLHSILRDTVGLELTLAVFPHIRYTGLLTLTVKQMDFFSSSRSK